MPHRSSRRRWPGALARLAARLLLRLTVHGAENVPASGGLLLTMNHLGGADPLLVIGYAGRPVTVAGKVELLSWPVIGAVVRAYGMIPLRRGEADRAALKQLLTALAEGQALLIAPEGHESLSGALEKAREGAAFLAQQADVAILPVGITGTGWNVVLPAWRHFRRPCVTLTFGRQYRLPAGLRRPAAAGFIMRQIAALLPAEYQGVYGERRPG